MLAANEKNYAKAISLLRPLAETGDAEAQFALGNLYFEGGDIPASDAYHWLEKAANQDHAKACYKLACLNEFRLRNGEEAFVALLLRAAEMGSPEAQTQLGTYYATGDWPGPRDLKEAAKWYAKAAEQSDPTALYEFGFMLLTGEGCEKDFGRAVRMLESAAEQGQVDAVKLIIDMYENGSYGGAKNPRAAERWRNLGKR